MNGSNCYIKAQIQNAIEYWEQQSDLPCELKTEIINDLTEDLNSINDQQIASNSCDETDSEKSEDIIIRRTKDMLSVLNKRTCRGFLAIFN